MSAIASFIAVSIRTFKNNFGYITIEQITQRNILKWKKIFNCYIKYIYTTLFSVAINYRALHEALRNAFTLLKIRKQIEKECSLIYNAIYIKI